MRHKDESLPAWSVLEPMMKLRDKMFPADRLLVLPPRSGDRLAVLDIGKAARVPRYVSRVAIMGYVRMGALTVLPFEPPASARTPLDALTPGALETYNRRVSELQSLFEGEDAYLLEYPDEFSRTCARYAAVNGLKESWVRKVAWYWLKNGRTLSALVPDLMKCGVSGKPRNLGERVGGPKQLDGEDFEVLAASGMSIEDRKVLRQQAERIWKRHRKLKSADERCIMLREWAKKKGLPQPSFAQAEYLERDVKKRARSANATGLLHQRHRGVYYASQEAEADSTKLQLFAKSEVDLAVKHKGPTLYKIVDVAWNYVAATLVTLDPPSNEVLAELLIRAMGGMESICREYGLPYVERHFPRLPPGQVLRVDHQELTSPKLNNALLRHLGMKVGFAVVAKGADKGTIEGAIGAAKREVRKRPDAFPKRAVGEVVERARARACESVQELDADLIKLAYQRNHRPVAASRVPADFMKTGRPANPVELFKWSLEQFPELVKPVPSVEQLNVLLRPTDYYPVHVGKGIYVDGKYYSSQALVEAGYLRKRAKGATPQVEAAPVRGTVAFVYWVRGKNDFQKCLLDRKQQSLEGLTVAEAKAHLEAMPSASKRHRLQMVQSAAHKSTSTSRGEAAKSREAAQQGHATRDRKRIEQAKAADRALGARRDFGRQFPEEAASERPVERPPTRVRPGQAVVDAQVDRVAAMLEARAREEK